MTLVELTALVGSVVLAVGLLRLHHYVVREYTVPAIEEDGDAESEE